MFKLAESMKIGVRPCLVFFNSDNVCIYNAHIRNFFEVRYKKTTDYDHHKNEGQPKHGQYNECSFVVLTCYHCFTQNHRQYVFNKQLGYVILIGTVGLVYLQEIYCNFEFLSNNLKNVN